MKRLLLALLLLPSLVYAQSAAQRLSQLGHVLNAGSPAASSSAGTIPMLQSGTVVVLSWPALINGDCLTNNGSTLSWMACSSGGMVYPGAGIPNSTGTAWGTSYSATNPIPANYVTVQTFTGDCTNSGTLTFTCSKVNGAAFPTSAVVVGSNASAQPVAATTTGSGSVVLATAPTVSNLTITGTCTGCGSGSSVTLQTNGTNNTSQTTLNLVGTGGVAVTNPTGGTVDIGPVSESVNAQTGTTYTVASTDCGKQITFNNAAAIAVTVPQATGSFASCQFDVTDIGAGTATLTPTTSTINGSSSLAVAQNRQCTVNSDGTNWQVIGCTALVSGGSGISSQIIGLSSGFVTPSGTQYIGWLAGTLGSGEGSQVAPRAGTISNMYVTGPTLAAATSLQITLRDNATSEAVTCTIAASTNNCNDLTHTFTFAAGDKLDFQTVQTGTGTGGTYVISFLVQ